MSVFVENPLEKFRVYLLNRHNKKNKHRSSNTLRLLNEASEWLRRASGHLVSSLDVVKHAWGRIIPKFHVFH